MVTEDVTIVPAAMSVHAIKKKANGKVQRHYLWEALKELKQPQSVDKALEISEEYAKDNNHQ